MQRPRSEHLAGHIEARRKELGYTPTTLADATGLSPQALKNIRNGEIRQYQERLTVPLTQALQWSGDSISRLLDGQAPVELSLIDRCAQHFNDHGMVMELTDGTIRLLSEYSRTAHLDGVVEALWNYWEDHPEESPRPTATGPGRGTSDTTITTPDALERLAQLEAVVWELIEVIPKTDRKVARTLAALAERLQDADQAT